MIAACSSDDTVPAMETPASIEQQQRDRAPYYILSQQREIKKRLKDPESAQFRNSAFYNSKVPVVCGEVNSKNGFGGYTGFQRFIRNGSWRDEQGVGAAVYSIKALRRDDKMPGGD